MSFVWLARRAVPEPARSVATAIGSASRLAVKMKKGSSPHLYNQKDVFKSNKIFEAMIMFKLTSTVELLLYCIFINKFNLMSQKVSLFLLRISLGWYFFYAGITKVFDPNWSAEGYLKGAKLLSGLYMWFASPAVLPYVNFVNSWGLTLLGISLILGAYIKYSAPLGALLMLLYYIPLGIIYPDAHSMIVDNHVIFIFVLLYFMKGGAGIWSWDERKK